MQSCVICGEEYEDLPETNVCFWCFIDKNYEPIPGDKLKVIKKFTHRFAVGSIVEFRIKIDGHPPYKALGFDVCNDFRYWFLRREDFVIVKKGVDFLETHHQRP